MYTNIFSKIKMSYIFVNHNSCTWENRLRRHNVGRDRNIDSVSLQLETYFELVWEAGSQRKNGSIPAKDVIQ